MKKISIIILFSFFACVGYDTSFLPQTIKESKEKGLLINIYSSSENIIKINNQNFEILEVWSTFKLEKKYSKGINYNFFAVRISLRNIKTGQVETPQINNNLLRLYCDNYSFNDIGITDGMVSIICHDIRLKDEIYSFKIGFIDNNKEKIVFFKKQ